VAHRPLREYSGGMKQRVGIIQALLNDPKLLIMDEPSTGLDPEERAGLRDLLSELAGDRIIILSTHIVSDVESIADHIALLEQGKLITFNTPQQLLALLHNQVWLCKISAPELAQHANNLCISNRVRQGDGYLIRLISKQQPLVQAKLTEPCLEDAYLYFNKVNQQQHNQLEQVA
jgi:ABC-type multidrug transport system ATPase subunit